jgi:hypothetical protein
MARVLKVFFMTLSPYLNPGYAPVMLGRGRVELSLPSEHGACAATTLYAAASEKLQAEGLRSRARLVDNRR